jgi:hypothetical protein
MLIPDRPGYEYPGGHIPDNNAYRRMLSWLRH